MAGQVCSSLCRLWSETVVPPGEGALVSLPGFSSAREMLCLAPPGPWGVLRSSLLCPTVAFNRLPQIRGMAPGSRPTSAQPAS